MKVLGAIIAGGSSTRMGEDKAFVFWRGKSLIAHVVERLALQVDELIISVKSEPKRFASFGLVVVEDQIDSGTPLAGLHAALCYARVHHFDAVVSVPCDTPLLPLDLRAKLQGEGPALAARSDQIHYLTGFWPVSVLSSFDNLESLRVKDFGAKIDARLIYWPETGHDPFINVNTMKDLSDLP